MDVQRRKRQSLLFLFAILIPAIVLLTFGGLVVRQERELSDKRLAEDRRQALEQLRRELGTRLEAIKLQEVNRLQDDPAAAAARRTADSPVVFVAAIEQDRVVMPWEDRRTPPRPGAEFEKYRTEGEAAEFVANDLAASADAYRRAIVAGRRTLERCAANLWLGRVLSKAGTTQEASDLYRKMMKDCDAVFDENGVTFGLYAADRLNDREYARERVAQNRWWPPMQAYLMQAMLGEESPDKLSLLIRDIEQMNTLAADFRGSMFRMEFPFAARMNESAWLASGDEPWLITVMSPAPTASPVVLAVSSRKIMPPGGTLLARHTAGSIPLGEGFLDLEVEWDRSRFSETRGVPATLYASGLGLILLATALAGYLLLRDVNRHLQMADLRSHFVASVSHELKTPLTAIRMLAETMDLGRSRDEARQSQYLQTIVNESERLSRLVDNVLDFSRIERGMKNYQMQPTALVEVVQSAARSMHYSLAQHGFKLEIAFEEELPSTMADRDALQQAILNLLTNAMKYSGKSRDIGLSLRRSGADAVIEVTDQGLGIPEQEHAKIFDKFYRVQANGSELIAGTGLGLTLTLHIVKAHGGRMELTSTVGQGSRFSMIIPLHSTETPA